LEVFRQTYLEESFKDLDIMESGLLNLTPGHTDLEETITIFSAAHSRSCIYKKSPLPKGERKERGGKLCLS